MHYIYRSVTRELADALDRIAEVGDAVLSCHHMGGRDWIIVCRKATDEVSITHSPLLHRVPGESA